MKILEWSMFYELELQYSTIQHRILEWSHNWYVMLQTRYVSNNDGKIIELVSQVKQVQKHPSQDTSRVSRTNMLDAPGS